MKRARQSISMSPSDTIPFKKGPAAILPFGPVDVVVAEVLAFLQPQYWQQSNVTLDKGDELLERTLALLVMAPPGVLTTPEPGKMQLWTKDEGMIFELEGDNVYHSSSIGSMARPSTMADLINSSVSDLETTMPDLFYPGNDRQFKPSGALCSFLEKRVDILVELLLPYGNANVSFCRQLDVLCWGLRVAARLDTFPGDYFSCCVNFTSDGYVEVYHSTVSTTLPVAMLLRSSARTYMIRGLAETPQCLSETGMFNLHGACQAISDLCNDVLSIRLWLSACSGFKDLGSLLKSQPDHLDTGITAVLDDGLFLAPYCCDTRYGPYPQDLPAMFAAIRSDFAGLLSPI